VQQTAERSADLLRSGGNAIILIQIEQESLQKGVFPERGIVMKKLLKRITSLSVCGLIFLTGCGVASTSLPSELAGQSGDYPEAVNILAPDFFEATGAANADQAKQKWMDEMSERYGTEFNVISSIYKDAGNTDSSTLTSDVTASETTTSSASNQETDNTTFVGIVSVSTEYISTLKSRIANDTIVPLENYLENNPVWNALPEDFKSLFEVDGHIYAIPTSVSRTQYARIIHNEALQETGITVTDLDSFRDFAVAYAKETGKAVSNFNAPEVMDILNAFGLYPGKDISSQFSYDPTEDCYVDFMTKPAAVEALEYLRELYEAGALYHKSAKVNSQLFQDGFFASKYDQYSDYSDCTEVLTLNPEYPQIIFTDIGGFAMTIDTPQPQETINLLVDMLFGSEQNYLECRLGSSDNYTLNSDGTITMKMAQDSEGNYVMPCMPNLAGELSDIFSYSNANILYSKNGVVDTESDTDAKEYNACVKLLNDSLENGSVIEIPLEYQIIESATYDASLTDSENDIGILFYVYFTHIIALPFLSAQQAIDEYKEEMLSLGGNQMLDEMNAAIGKKTAYYYG